MELFLPSTSCQIILRTALVSCMLVIVRHSFNKSKKLQYFGHLMQRVDSLEKSLNYVLMRMHKNQDAGDQDCRCKEREKYDVSIFSDITVYVFHVL